MRGRGFTNVGRVTYSEVNLDELISFAKDAEVSPETLKQARLIKDATQPVVILGRGSVSVPLKIRAHRVTESARKKIEAAGGSVEIIEG